MNCSTWIDNAEPRLDTDPSSPAAAAAEHQGAEIRVEKVLDIKRQLMEGRYTLADKLDVVVDRLLEDLL